MTLRTKSRGRQWTVWLCGLLALGSGYVIFSRCLYNAVSWNFLDPRAHRLMLALAALFVCFVRETRWIGAGEGDGTGEDERGEENAAGGDVCQSADVADDAGAGPDAAGKSSAISLPSVDSAPVRIPDGAPPPPHQPRPSVPSSDSASTSGPAPAFTGEELYARARSIPHQPMPDFVVDGLYLDLLGQSAAKGFAPAMAKLGEYAMRRGAWVEAYYWMSMAKRKGQKNLDAALREIRRGWSMDGFPDQISNANGVFTVEAGSIGRALLCVDSGHGAAKAREFLNAYFPDLSGNAT